jgi:hypothetical protein
MSNATEDGAHKAKAGKPSRWSKRILIWVIGFFISLAAGWVVERVTEPEMLRAAKEAQDGWIKAASATSPFSVATTYWEDIQIAWRGAPPNSDHYDINASKGAGIATPIVALFITGSRFFEAGGISVIVQLLLGALAVALFNYNRSKGQTIFFEDGITNLLLAPVAIVLAASFIGLVLQLVMLGALYALSWVTGLAAAAAGATGIAGFCWFCFTKLSEKGIEHVATPKIG